MRSAWTGRGRYSVDSVKTPSKPGEPSAFHVFLVFLFSQAVLHRDPEASPLVYSISSSETSNQMRHWKREHWDHFWDYRLADLEKLGMSPDAIDEIKEKELADVMGKKQTDIVSAFAVSLSD